MRFYRSPSLTFLFLIPLMLGSACGGSGSAGGGGSDGPPCQTNAECSSGLVCLDTGFGGLCTPTCSVEANECGGSAGCSGVGLLEVNICKEEAETPAEVTPEEEPKIRCATDEDCALLQPGTLCVQWKGAKECTIPCAVESDCDMPSMGGMSIDFMTCGPDEAVQRSACIPRQECFVDILQCITMPGMGEGISFGDDFDDFGDE